MQAKRYVLVSFATSKGAGSERGVGWAFVCAAVELATTTSPETHIHIILDDRDRDNVEANLPVALPVNLHLHYVGMPRILARIPGEAKTRLSYLFWLFPAQKNREIDSCFARRSSNTSSYIRIVRDAKHNPNLLAAKSGH